MVPLARLRRQRPRAGSSCERAWRLWAAPRSATCLSNTPAGGRGRWIKCSSSARLMLPRWVRGGGCALAGERGAQSLELGMHAAPPQHRALCRVHVRGAAKWMGCRTGSAVSRLYTAQRPAALLCVHLQRTQMHAVPLPASLPILPLLRPMRQWQARWWCGTQPAAWSWRTSGHTPRRWRRCSSAHAAASWPLLPRPGTALMCSMLRPRRPRPARQQPRKSA